jgi:hypothetical protein
MPNACASALWLAACGLGSTALEHAPPKAVAPNDANTLHASGPSAPASAGAAAGGAGARGMIPLSIHPDYIACQKDPSSCTSLVLAGRSLSGTIPSDLGRLTALTEL